MASRATELLRIRRVRNSVSQHHTIGTNRKRSYFSFFLSSFFSASHYSQTTINHYYYYNNNHKNNEDERKPYWKNLFLFKISLSDVQKRIMRSNSTSATGGGDRDHHHHHHHRRLFIRNFLTDFRRQSSVNDYKFPNTLVCTIIHSKQTNLIFSRDFHRFTSLNRLSSLEIQISTEMRMFRYRNFSFNSSRDIFIVFSVISIRLRTNMTNKSQDNFKVFSRWSLDSVRPNLLSFLPFLKNWSREEREKEKKRDKYQI